jgi:transposase
VRVAHEASPTGYGLAVSVGGGVRVHGRDALEDPVGIGDKVKTERRDAERLARLLRHAELVPVRVPEPHEEVAARDLSRTCPGGRDRCV